MQRRAWKPFEIRGSRRVQKKNKTHNNEDKFSLKKPTQYNKTKNEKNKPKEKQTYEKNTTHRINWPDNGNELGIRDASVAV